MGLEAESLSRGAARHASLALSSGGASNESASSVRDDPEGDRPDYKELDKSIVRSSLGYRGQAATILLANRITIRFESGRPRHNPVPLRIVIR